MIIQAKIKYYFSNIAKIDSMKKENTLNYLFNDLEMKNNIDLKEISRENPFFEKEIEDNLKKTSIQPINDKNKMIYFAQLNVKIFLIYRTFL